MKAKIEDVPTNTLVKRIYRNKVTEATYTVGPWVEACKGYILTSTRRSTSHPVYLKKNSEVIIIQ